MLRRRASGGLLDVLVLEDLLVERVEDDLLPVAADPLAYALPQPTERFEGGGRVFGEDHRSGLPRARFGANPPLADLRTDAWMHCAPEGAGSSQTDTGGVFLQMLEDVGAEGTRALEQESAMLTEWLGGTRVLPRFPSPLSRLG